MCPFQAGHFLSFCSYKVKPLICQVLLPFPPSNTFSLELLCMNEWRGILEFRVQCPPPRFTHSSLTLHTHACILNNGTNNSQTKSWASEHYKENYPGAFLRKHRSSLAWQHIPSAPDNIRAENELNDFRRQAFKTVVASSLCPGTQKQWTEFSGHGVWRS